MDFTFQELFILFMFIPGFIVLYVVWLLFASIVISVFGGGIDE